MKKTKQKAKLPQQGRVHIGGKTISPELFNKPDRGSSDHMNPVFSFSDTCHNHFPLESWQGSELKHLIDKLRDMSKRPWAEIRRNKGFIIVDQRTFSTKLPDHLSEDLTIYEFRVSQRARVFGHRIHNSFHIIWFDRNHEVYPMS